MPKSYTPNYNLVKDDENEFYNVAVQSNNMDLVDAALKDLDDTKEELIKNATAKTSMVDADVIPLADSADSFKTKKISFANLKAILKTYFDTLYNNYTHPTTAGNKHIPSGGSSGKILVYSADGTATWGDAPSTTTIVDNLTSTSSTSALSANQGKVLNDDKAPKASPVFSGTPKVGTALMYHTGNVTISTVAPSSALAEGAIHMVY